LEEENCTEEARVSAGLGKGLSLNAHLGDGLGALRDGVLGELSGKDEADRCVKQGARISQCL
jgi:hypothetical protein